MKILLFLIISLLTVANGKEERVENFYRSKEYMLSHMKTGLKWDPLRFLKEGEKYFITFEFYSSEKPNLKSQLFKVHKLVVEDPNNFHEGFSFYLPANQNVKSMIVGIRIPNKGGVKHRMRIFNIEDVKIKLVAETDDPLSKFNLKF